MRAAACQPVAALLLAATCGASEPPAAAPAAEAAPLKLLPIAAPKPSLPDAACRQRLAGWVDLEFAVLPDGRVTSVQVARADPPGIFDAAATAAVAGRLYPAQGEPVKMRERMVLGLSDCRPEQLSVAEPVAPAQGGLPIDCAALAATARAAGEPFARHESGRAVLSGQTAQVYSAPDPGCAVAGKTLRSGGRLTAWREYREYSFVSGPQQDEAAAVWVFSKQLKDVEIPAGAP